MVREGSEEPPRGSNKPLPRAMANPLTSRFILPTIRPTPSRSAGSREMGFSQYGKTARLKQTLHILIFSPFSNRRRETHPP